MLRRVSGCLLFLLAVAGCDAELSLLVDVVTDRAPGEGFDRVELRVEDAVTGELIHEEAVEVDSDADFTAGVRIATVDPIPAGDYRVIGRLLLGGEEVASESTSVSVMTSYAVTLTFAAPACVVDDEVCNGLDDDCDGSVDEGDAIDLCPLSEVDEAACDAGRCQILACAPGRDDCDVEAETGCETDLSTDDASCGACGAACSDGRVCNLAACRGMGAYVDERVIPTGRAFDVFTRGDGFLLQRDREWRALDGALGDVWARTFAEPSDGYLTVASGAGPDGDAWALLGLVNWSSVDVVYDIGGPTVTVPAGQGLTVVARYAGDDGRYLDHRTLRGVVGGVGDAGGIESGGAVSFLGVDDSGAYALGGMSAADADLGTGTIPGPFWFVAVYEADDSVRFVKSAALPEASVWRALVMGGAISPAGQVVTWFEPDYDGTLDLGNGPVVVTRDMTVAVSYRGEGELAWFERYRATPVGGALRDDGTFTFVMEPPSATPNPDSRVEVRSPTGELLHAYAIFPTGLIGQPAVGVGRQGGLYLAGTLGIPVDFGGGRRAPLLDAGVLVAYGVDGTYRYDRHFSEPGSSRFVDMAVSGDRVLLSGALTGNLDFGGGARTGDNSPLLLLLTD